MLLRSARHALSAQARFLSNVSAISSSASSSADNWLTVAATVVERVPLILPDSPEWKKRFDDMQTHLNNRFAKKIPTFLRKRLDEKFSEPELVRFRKEFKPASRITQADLDDDRQSLKRKLSQSLLLIVKNDNGEWVLPQGQWEEPESIRKTAERTLKNVVGSKLECAFTGQAPLIHLVQEFDPTEQKKLSARGKKVFFLRSLYIGENVEPRLVSDYLWVTKDELSEYVAPDVHKCIKAIVLT